jgi:hypothetical protein
MPIARSETVPTSRPETILAAPVARSAEQPPRPAEASASEFVERIITARLRELYRARRSAPPVNCPYSLCSGSVSAPWRFLSNRHFHRRCLEGATLIRATAYKSVASRGFPFVELLSDICGIGGACAAPARITKPAAARRAHMGQGRDRLPSCPHPVWSSIQFAIGCRSDHGSRRSCRTPVR